MEISLYFKIIIFIFLRFFIELGLAIMTDKTEALHKRRENLFFFLLLLTAAVFPYSEALVSISIGLLLFQALTFRSWNHPTVKKRSLKIALLPFSIFGLYIAGTLFTKDFSFALYELKKVIFWLVVPLAVILSPQLPDKKLYRVLGVFVISVTIASFIITGKIILNDYFKLNGFRSFSIISHIRYSFQVVLSLIIVAWFIIKHKQLRLTFNPIFLFALFIWLVVFLFLLKSLLGIISFLGTVTIALVLYIMKLRNRQVKYTLVAALLALVIIPAFYTGKVYIDYYDFKDVNPEEVERRTQSGNFYHHDFKENARENGYLVFIYICEEELRKEWNKRSEIKYGDNLNGYPLSSTLIRYLTSLGYRKDSVGINRLSPKDIKLIEQGVTNYKFDNRLFSIYPRIYETIWELDNYFRTDNPNNKSLAQRIEFVKASLLLIKENTWLGIGTGNWVIEYNKVYDRMDSKLDEEKRGPSHNQYLNYMVKFGIIGFLWILLAVLYPVFHMGHRRNFIFVFFLITIAFANLGDANLETHMGLSFFSFFYFLFLWNSTTEMEKSIVEP